LLVAFKLVEMMEGVADKLVLVVADKLVEVA
jgi:hypothetical protein